MLHTPMQAARAVSAAEGSAGSTRGSARAAGRMILAEACHQGRSRKTRRPAGTEVRTKKITEIFTKNSESAGSAGDDVPVPQFQQSVEVAKEIVHTIPMIHIVGRTQVQVVERIQ